VDSGSQAPDNTRKRSGRPSTKQRTRLVFPTPDSPPTSTRRPACHASSRQASSRSSKPSRSTSCMSGSYSARRPLANGGPDATCLVQSRRSMAVTATAWPAWEDPAFYLQDPEVMQAQMAAQAEAAPVYRYEAERLATPVWVLSRWADCRFV